MYKKRKKQRKLLRRELVSNRKYHTKYKDIKKYFTLINREVFNNELSPFGKIEIKEIRDRIKYCYGLVEVLEWERKGTRIYRPGILPRKCW